MTERKKIDVQSANIAELKMAGYTAKELRDAGFSPNEIKEAGLFEEECYFCHRTLEQCKGYVESLKGDFIDKIGAKKPEDIEKIVMIFDDICRFGMNRVKIGAVILKDKQVRIEVPMCPVCERYMRSITDDIYFDISVLEERIQ